MCCILKSTQLGANALLLVSELLKIIKMVQTFVPKAQGYVIQNLKNTK